MTPGEHNPDLRSEQKLRHAQKMEALGRLAGEVAHDFNNTLNGIIGISSDLLSKKSSDDPDYEDLEAIQRAAERATLFTRQLLSMARQRPLEKKDVDLVEVLSDTISFVQRTAPATVQWSINLGSGISTISGDAHQLGQVFLNLLVNAVDALEDKEGLIKIEGGQGPLSADEQVRFSEVAAHAEKWVRLSISDRGEGIPPEALEQVFDPFFTTKQEGKGTGLGLAIVYGIVRSHGGIVDVESEVGVGSSFKIYLPVQA